MQAGVHHKVAGCQSSFTCVCVCVCGYERLTFIILSLRTNGWAGKKESEKRRTEREKILFNLSFIKKWKIDKFAC